MMKKLSIAGSIFVVIVLLAACQEEYQPLPKLGNADIDYATGDTLYPIIPEFAYLNQDSVLITSGQMKGKVWIADFFFTSCPTICPKMTVQMKRLSEHTADLSDAVQYMSFSINPTNDQPSVLRRYIAKHGITSKNWYFFTGDEEFTHVLGTEHFLIHANADDEAPGGFAHGPAFTLVDRDGIVRGVYDGTEPSQVDLLEKDLRKLLKYEYGIE